MYINVRNRLWKQEEKKGEELVEDAYIILNNTSYILFIIRNRWV